MGARVRKLNPSPYKHHCHALSVMAKGGKKSQNLFGKEYLSQRISRMSIQTFQWRCTVYCVRVFGMFAPTSRNAYRIITNFSFRNESDR